jgi:class 3 adenylate cyclase
MLSKEQEEEIASLVNTSLNRAEEMWENVGDLKKSIRGTLEETRTFIPGHPYLKENEYRSDRFIAMMIDMRDSTKHLRQAISEKIAKVSLMQRVFYEVSALLPTMAKVIEFEEGAVTEYLGDGVLALFQLPKTKKEEEAAIYASSCAARNSLYVLDKFINPILKSRYSLPPIRIGVGIAFSDAIITSFGIPPNSQVKVIGQSIYFASNLSKGINEIIVHEWLENIWPKSDTGKIRFSKKDFSDNIKGYVLYEAGNA